MGKPDVSRLEALDALLAEKRKHEGYLAKLEERRASTPSNVYERLHDTYLLKVTDLQVKAAAEAELLAEGIADEESAVADIEARLAAATEERLEGELRAEIGEYDPKEWAKRRDVLNALIAKIEKERDSRFDAFERARVLIVEARAGSRWLEADEGATASPASARDDEVAPRARPAAASERADAEAEASPPQYERTEIPPTPIRGGNAVPPGAAPMAGSPSFDELAFLSSVVGRGTTPAAPVPRASRPVTELREGGKPATPSVPAPPAVPPPRKSTPVPAPAEPAPAAASESAEPPSSILDRSTPRGTQPVKTLKCQECGTFNYPTEWYCERCGGELAAL